jgi:glycine betaine/choline ABC-type transport system substrate-binding protein
VRRTARLALGVLALALVSCGGPPATGSMGVGSLPDTASVVLAEVYAAALRSYGTPAHVETAPDPLARLDAGSISVVPGFTGELLQTFQPGAGGRSDTQVYRQMVGALPEGVAAGDYTTAAEDKPALAVTEATAHAWGGRDLTALARNCDKVVLGALQDIREPLTVGRCKLPIAREFPNDTTLFDALGQGQINAAWTSTADPDVPAELIVLADDKPALVQAENIVPLYRRNELTDRQLLAINEIAGVLDTAALVDMRRQVADGADPRMVAEAWLGEHPLGR